MASVPQFKAIILWSCDCTDQHIDMVLALPSHSDTDFVTPITLSKNIFCISFLHLITHQGAISDRFQLHL